MKQSGKHITTLLLIAILSLPVILPCMTMIIEGFVRWEMTEALEEKELVTIVVDAKTIVWEEAGKECRINGRLFDVKQVKKLNHQYRLKGLYDDREREIEVMLGKMTQHSKQELASTICKLMHLHYVKKEKIELPERNIISINTKYAIVQKNKYSSPFLANLTEPPEQL